MSGRESKFLKLIQWLQKQSGIVSSAIIALGSIVLAESVNHRSYGADRHSRTDNAIALWQVESELLGLGIFFVCFGIFFGLRHLRDK